jgi:hypothetical protein
MEWASGGTGREVAWDVMEVQEVRYEDKRWIAYVFRGLGY